MLRRAAFVVGSFCCAVLATPIVGAEPSAEPVRFNRDIRPILSDRCFACHGPDEASLQAELRLDLRERAVEYAVVPGDAEGSELLARIAEPDPEFRMPPPESNKPPLSPEQVELFRRWIDQGAKYERHWSFLPVERSEPAGAEENHWPRGAIDRFLREAQRQPNIEPSPQADRTTLVRRLYLDLIGLPPTPAQVEAFLNDGRDDAYERLVEELLASPHYGERMASWWFDLVRFSNTVGYHGDQDHRILPYRDYVIKALNDNLPFDQFTIEQLAGDLLPNPTMWQLVATGYNRLLQTTHEGGAQDAEYRAIYLADRVRNFSEVWMGASVGCAQCHDHKFDPYSQRDFYSLGAFFADVDWYGSFADVGGNELPTDRPPEMLAWTLPIYEQVQQVETQIQEIEQKLSAGRLPKEYRKLQRQRAELEQKLATLENQFVPTMITQATEPRAIRVLARGDWMDKSGPVVEPGTPGSLPPLGVEGRRANRLDLARWLVSGEHPQTARVLMNRLWHRYFGRGISSVLIDTGSQGQWPDHPELLDWLAAELVDSGWDVKHMVRLIVTSSAYRQTSVPSEQLNQIDPENRLFARQGRYRLGAEQIRDSALAVSGLLAPEIGGVFSRPYQPAGYYSLLNFPAREYQPSQGDDQYRRGVYTHWQRQYLHPWLTAFDAPTREECTAQRPISNTPSAALVLLNDPSFVEAARKLAERIVVEAEGDDAARVAWAWRQVLSRQAAEEETTVLLELLNQRRQQFADDAESAAALATVGDASAPANEKTIEVAAWTDVARALLNCSEAVTRN